MQEREASGDPTLIAGTASALPQEPVPTNTGDTVTGDNVSSSFQETPAANSALDGTSPIEPIRMKKKPEQVALLLPVWGRQFAMRFLEFSLPTLLSPNNIPSISNILPCKFVLMTSAVDEALITAHPAWQKLEQYCDIKIELIDDLITERNHTATITLAFERALRDTGVELLTTCHIFLMSDYLISDGSLDTVVKKILNSDVNCILAGNFQVISEDAMPLLRQAFDPTSLEIVLKPRELIGWSVAHLHAATLANLVNLGLMHNAHTNRLFWRVDKNTMIGRFFLMHPIAIVPEVQNFVISSSWDYSFVPELCPSNRTMILADSDEYLVIELQNRNYEQENLRAGPIDPTVLAASLEEWTTRNHREYARSTIVFHAAEFPRNLAEVIEQSNVFVEGVLDAVAAPPQSHRQHPYWLGSLAVNRRLSHQPLSREDWTFLMARRPVATIEEPDPKQLAFPPEMKQMHPLWPDYRLPAAAMHETLSAGGRLLLLVRPVELFARWLVLVDGDISTSNISDLLHLSSAHYQRYISTFDTCIAVLGVEDLEEVDELLVHVAPLLKPQGRMSMLICNDERGDQEFTELFLRHTSKLINQHLWIEDTQYVELNARRQHMRQSIMLSVAPPIGAAALGMSVANGAALVSSMPPGGACSSICLTLRASMESAPLPLRIKLEARHSDLKTRPAGSPVSIEEEASQERLGRKERFRWEDNTSGIIPACKFLLNLMGTRHDVAEVGCGSPQVTYAALQLFKRISLFEPRREIVNEVERLFQDDWRFSAEVYNVLDGPLPRKVDSIYSIGFMQYITRDEEDAWVRNLRDSLSREFDFLVLSCPSFASYQAKGKEVISDEVYDLRENIAHSVPGNPFNTHPLNNHPFPTHPNLRTAEELRGLMERFFQNVFIFSVVNDVVEPGAAPAMSTQQVLALACQKKP